MGHDLQPDEVFPIHNFQPKYLPQGSVSGSLPKDGQVNDGIYLFFFSKREI